MPHFLHADKNAKDSFISELAECYKTHDSIGALDL
jgi:hypothetical protein